MTDAGNRDFRPSERQITEIGNRNENGLYGFLSDPSARTIYADNFFSGLAPWMVIPATTETGALDNTKSTGGTQSIKLTTLAAANSTITVAKLFPVPATRAGLEFLAMLPIATANWTFDMTLAWQLDSIHTAYYGRIRFQNNTGSVDFFRGTTSTTVTSIAGSSVLMPALGAPYNSNLWIDFKIALDFINAKWMYFNYNGRVYDLSAFIPYGSTGLGQNTLMVAWTFASTAAVAKSAWIDSILVTRDEP